MTTLAEPEWDQETRDLVNARDAVRECPVCKGDPAECQDPERAYNWEVPPPTRCWRQTALIIEQDKVEDDKTSPSQALLWSAYLRHDAIAAAAAAVGINPSSPTANPAEQGPPQHASMEG